MSLAPRVEHFEALVGGGRRADAVPHCECCVAANAGWMKAHMLLGVLQLQLGPRAAAKVTLEAALRWAIDRRHEDPTREVRELPAEF